jgi:asparagine synthase (glutamine-hydrolysing)
MCGIAGLFRLTGCPSSEDVAAVVRMMDAQMHRGPDDWGLLVPDAAAGAALLAAPGLAEGRDHLREYPYLASGPGVVLGTRRLSILDRRSRARMPMGTRDRRLWIAHNGEVYNYRELRAELAADGAFRSEADTEALLRGWEAWREAVLPRIRGMFAVAIFEAGPPARLFLARDRFGIKPLYYYRDGERVIFASELRALLQSGVVPRDTDAGALARFLELGSVPPLGSTVKGVRAVPAGHCVRIDLGGLVSRAYWELSTHLGGAVPAPSPAAAAATTRALLEDAVALHLASDVPLGLFLSGGIDSSALVALVPRARPEPLVTLCIGFDEPGYSETRYARLVAERYGTDHREVILGSDDLFAQLPEIFAAMDEPTVDGVNTYLIARAARAAGLTVALSGIGGDEVFLGYRHLRAATTLDAPRALFGALPAWARRASVQAMRRAGALWGRTGVDKLAYLDEPSAEGTYRLFRALFTPRQVQDLLGMGERELGLSAAPPSGARDERPLVEQFTALEFGGYLQSQLLRDADVMGMAHSLEIRVPYLDHRLVEYVLGLPPAVKLHRRGSKPLLTRALGEDLPREVWDRPKMGFTFPFDPWMRRRADELAAISLDRTPLEPAAVRAVWEAFKAGRVHWSRPWALIVLAQVETARRSAAAVRTAPLGLRTSG